MLLMQFGPTVTVINRVVSEDGKRVPYEGMLDGQPFVVVDTMDLPTNLARIIVHNSMFRIDPVTSEPQYRLAIKSWNMDVSDVPVHATEGELVDRSLLPEPRLKSLRSIKIHNPIQRRDPTTLMNPGARADGAFSGGHGESYQ